MTPHVHFALAVLSLCLFAVAAWQDRSPQWNRLVSIAAFVGPASLVNW